MLEGIIKKQASLIHDVVTLNMRVILYSKSRVGLFPPPSLGYRPFPFSGIFLLMRG